MALATATRPVDAAAEPSVAASRRRWHRHRPRTFYTFAAPWLIGFALLTLFPLVYAFWLSFTNYDGLSPKWGYVGLDNYERAFADPKTWSSLVRTLIFVFVLVPATVGFGLLLAVLVNQKLPGRGAFRAVFFLPVVVPVVAAGFVFRMLFDRDTGAATVVMGWFGLAPVEWLADDKALVGMLLMILWRVGGSMVISLAALQGVPQELLDAAAIDGAGSWRTFFRVTMPIMSPVLFFQVVNGVIDTLQIYLPALLLSAAGQARLDTIPGDSLYIYMVHVYSQAFAKGDLGYASALLWLLTAITLIYTALVFRFSRRYVYYESGPSLSGERE